MTEFEAFPNDFARIDEAKIVVMTIPKAAHSSIMMSLAATFARPGEVYKAACERWRAHKSPDVPADYLSVGFCRDPLDRFRSCWQDKIATVNQVRGALASFGCRPRMTLDEFSALVANTEDGRLDRHLIPQHYKFLADGRLRVRTLFRFEHLAAAWQAFRAQVLAHCGRHLAELARYNVSRPMDYQWSEHSRRLIAERYSRDHVLV